MPDANTLSNRGRALDGGCCISVEFDDNEKVQFYSSLH